MKGVALLRNLSLHTRNLLPTPPKFTPKPDPSPAPVAPVTRSAPRFFSSESGSSEKPSSGQTQNPVGSADGEDVVSTEEFKRQVGRFYKGDEEALPLVFESILKRKMAGINDGELMDELARQPRAMDDSEDEDFDDEPDRFYEDDDEYSDFEDDKFSDLGDDDDDGGVVPNE